MDNYLLCILWTMYSVTISDKWPTLMVKRDRWWGIEDVRVSTRRNNLWKEYEEHENIEFTAELTLMSVCRWNSSTRFRRVDKQWITYESWPKTSFEIVKAVQERTLTLIWECFVWRFTYIKQWEELYIMPI